MAKHSNCLVGHADWKLPNYKTQTLAAASKHTAEANLTELLIRVTQDEASLPDAIKVFLRRVPTPFDLETKLTKETRKVSVAKLPVCIAHTIQGVSLEHNTKGLE